MVMTHCRLCMYSGRRENGLYRIGSTLLLGAQTAIFFLLWCVIESRFKTINAKLAEHGGELDRLSDEHGSLVSLWGFGGNFAARA